MAMTIHFYLLNDDFSQEYADMHNDGKESEMNRLYEWEDELEITAPVDEVKVEEGEYVLRGQRGESVFEEVIPEMSLFKLESDGKLIATLACSSLLLNEYKKEDVGGNLILKVYLKDKEPLSNPIPGVYIAAKHFPESLIEE